MLVLEHMRQLVKACRPETIEEARYLLSQINPVKYGNEVLWLAAGNYNLATYQVPDEAQFHIVLRVECYTVNYTAAAADFGSFEPPPPGFAFWQYAPYGVGATYALTTTSAPTHLALDSDEFLIFKGGYNARLLGNFEVSPDATTRRVRALVYGYDCGAEVANRIGRGEMLFPSQ